MKKTTKTAGGSSYEDDDEVADEELEGEAKEAEAKPEGAPKGVKGNLTEGSVTIGVDKPEGIVAGMAVSGEGLDYGATVVRVDGNGVVLDRSATLTKEGVDLSFA